MIFNRKLVWRVWSIWLFLNLSLLIIASLQTAETGSRIACIYPLAYWDDSAIIEFYLMRAKAIATMIVTHYVAADVFDVIAKLRNWASF